MHKNKVSIISLKEVIQVTNEYLKNAFSIIDHYRKTNWNDSLLYVDQINKHWKDYRYYFLTSTCRNWNFHTLLIEIHNGTVSLETNLAVSCISRDLRPYVITHATVASSFLEIYSKEEKHTFTWRHGHKGL